MNGQRLDPSLFLLCLLLLAQAGCKSPGEADSGDAAAPQPAARATDTDGPLAAMGQALAGATALSFTAETSTEELLEEGPMVEYFAEIRVSLRRPDRLHAEVRGDLAHRELWFDGRSLSVVDHGLGVFCQLDLPEDARTIEGLLDHLHSEYDITFPLADFVLSDPHAAFRAAARAVERVGSATVQDVPCAHFAFTGEHADWQLWIHQSEPPVPRKFVVSERRPGQPEYAALFTEWDLAAELSEEVLVFQVPRDLGEVDLADLLDGPEGGER